MSQDSVVHRDRRDLLARRRCFPPGLGELSLRRIISRFGASALFCRRLGQQREIARRRPRHQLLPALRRARQIARQPVEPRDFGGDRLPPPAQGVELGAHVFDAVAQLSIAFGRDGKLTRLGAELGEPLDLLVDDALAAFEEQGFTLVAQTVERGLQPGDPGARLGQRIAEGAAFGEQ